MKRILFITTLLLMSCEKEELQPNTQDSQATTSENCNCDRIVDIKTFNMIGDAQSGTSSYFWCHITTINDCSKMQKFREFDYSKDYYTQSQLPKIGNCHDMGY